MAVDMVRSSYAGVLQGCTLGGAHCSDRRALVRVSRFDNGDKSISYSKELCLRLEAAYAAGKLDQLIAMSYPLLVLHFTTPPPPRAPM